MKITVLFIIEILFWMTASRSAEILQLQTSIRLPLYNGKIELDEYSNPVLFDLKNNEIILMSGDFKHQQVKQVFMYETQSTKFYAKSSSYSAPVGLIFYSPYRKSYYLTDYEIDFIADEFQLAPAVTPDAIYFFEPSSLYILSEYTNTLYYYPSFLTSRQIVKPLSVPRFHTIVGQTEQHELIIFDKKLSQFYFFSASFQSECYSYPEDKVPRRIVVRDHQIFALPEVGNYLYSGIMIDTSGVIWNKIKFSGPDDHWSDMATDKQSIFTLSRDGSLSHWIIQEE